MRSKILLATLAVAALAHGTARADIIFNYSFANNVFAWDTNTSGHYVQDGGYLSGSFTFDWTTNETTNVHVTSSAPISGTPSTVIYTADVNSAYRGTYKGQAFTYGGTIYKPRTPFAEIYLYTNGNSTYLDFTKLTLSSPFPGLVNDVHTSSYDNTRILDATVTSSGQTSTPSISVPEPASMALLAAGIAGIGLIRRRKV